MNAEREVSAVNPRLQLLSVCSGGLVATQLVPSWCPVGARLVPGWCPVGARLVPGWCLAGARLVPGWCPVARALLCRVPLLSTCMNAAQQLYVLASFMLS